MNNQSMKGMKLRPHHLMAAENMYIVIKI